MKPTQQMLIEMQVEYLRIHRRMKRESQKHFWSRFGVTQSRGCRFEKGAEMPKPVAILLELYFNGVVTDGDLETCQISMPRFNPESECIPGSPARHESNSGKSQISDIGIDTTF